VVAVVGEDNVRLGHADDLLDVGPRTIHRCRHRCRHLQATLDLCPEADLEGVRAQGWELLRCGLVERERLDLAVDGLPARRESVD
jgi:hypothetical protein